MFNRFVEIPLYRGELGLIVSDDINKIQTLIPEFEEDEIFGHSVYHDHNGVGCFTIILNYNHPTAKIKLGTIAHESHHLTSMILYSRGVEADFNNDEPSAYLIEWIFNKLIEWLKEGKFEV